jgi:hypothetical protein
MEKIALSVLFIFLNAGIYFLFIFNERLKVSRNIKVSFFLFFLLIYIYSEVSKTLYLDIIRMSIFLLGLYLIGSVALTLILKFFAQRNIRISKVIRKIAFFFILPIYTTMVTVVQIVLLFKSN